MSKAKIWILYENQSEIKLNKFDFMSGIYFYVRL